MNTRLMGEGYNLIADRKICVGYRALVDKLDECINELTTQQKSALAATLNQAWAVIERRKNERRANV